MKPEIKKTIIAFSIVAVVAVIFGIFVLKNTNESKEKAIETAKKTFYKTDSSSSSDNKEKQFSETTENITTEEETLEYAEQHSETIENTTVKDFDVEEFKNQADDVFVNSIGQECYIMKSDGAIAFNVFLDTSKDDDDIIEQIMLGITLCWSNYCNDDYSLMSFMFFDLDGNNICYYAITNILGKFSDLGNDIIWADKYKQYQEAYNNSVYKEHLKIFKPEN